MASVDFYNINGTQTGNSQQGRVTIRSSASKHKQRSPIQGDDTYDLDNFDNDDNASLGDRMDDVRYYFPILPGGSGS